MLSCQAGDKKCSSAIINRYRKSPWTAVPMAEAWAKVEKAFGENLAKLQSIREVSFVEIDQLLGTVLAEDVFASAPVPPYRASIKDGYAVIASDGAGKRRVVGSSLADICPKGENNVRKIISGECLRITTGAPLPPGADAIVPVEDTELLEHDGEEELMINITKAPNVGQDIREIGSDVPVGQLLLAKGAVIRPAEIGLLALSGLRKIRVFSRCSKVAVMSTGDEIEDPFTVSGRDQQTIVCDTNRPVLLSLFASLKVPTADWGIVRDKKEEIIARIDEALFAYRSPSSGSQGDDILVVTGGASMGERDFLKEVLVDHFHFTIHFGRVFMKPGLPTTFASGVFDGRPKFVFSLPGNPVSAFVCAHLFVVPMLKMIAGETSYWPTRINVQLDSTIEKLDSRPEYRRAVFRGAPPIPVDGEGGKGGKEVLFRAECVPGSQLSSRLLSTASANLLLELPPKTEEKSGLSAGEVVQALVIGPI